MKIAHLVSTFPKLSETFILNQIIGLQNRGHETDIYALRNSGESIEHEVIEENELTQKTRYANCPINKFNRILKSPFPLLKVLKNNPGLAIKSFKFYKYGKPAYNLENIYRASTFAPNMENYSILHAHFGPVGNATRLWAHHTETPLVVSFYGHDVSQALKENPQRYDSLFEEADQLIAVNSDMRMDLEKAGAPSSNISEVPIGIDTNRFKFKATGHDQKCTILMVSRMVEKKGYEYAIDAVSKIADTKPIKFEIVGDGPLRTQIEEQLKNSGITDHVTIHGMKTLDEVRELMYDADIFLQPLVTSSSGDKSPTSTVILQAQSTGLPVVSTNHGGIPEIVKDGETGFLVNEKNSEALSEALTTLIESPDLRSQMGKDAAKFIRENYSLTDMITSLLSVYKKVQQK